MSGTVTNVNITTSGVTRNQSIALYTSDSLVLYAPKYGDEVVFKHSGTGSLEVKSGMLVLRDTTATGQVKTAIAGTTLVDVIGIFLMNDTVTLAAGGTVNGQLLIGGEINADSLILPIGVTLDTVVGNRFLRNILADKGFVLRNIVEHSNL